VHGNTFRLTPAHIGTTCTFQNDCGLNAVFSNYGSYPSWSPYKGTVVQNAITYNQNNTFSDNTYEGSWEFLPFEQGNLKTFAGWQAAPYNQDAGSTLNSSSSTTPPPSSSDTTPPTVSITAPLSASTVAGTVNVEASATDDTGVVKVEFKVDNGQAVTDTSAPYTYSWNSASVNDGTHTISATAFDAAGNSTPASIQVTVKNATSQPPTTSGNGLQATYFDNQDFTGHQVARTDKTVNFNWGTGSPDSSIGNNTFSARWVGKIMVPATGKYTFYTRSDDGVRLWINGQLLVDNWTLHSVTENKAQVTLTAGQKYDIKMEYYENTGKAVAKLSWSSATLSKQIVPTNYLYTR
jgi:hypothetical protein